MKHTEARATTMSLDLGNNLQSRSSLERLEPSTRNHVTEIRFDPEIANNSAEFKNHPPGFGGRRRSKSQGHLFGKSSFEINPFDLELEDDLDGFSEHHDTFVDDSDVAHYRSSVSINDLSMQKDPTWGSKLKNYDLIGEDIDNIDPLASRVVGGRKWASSFHAFERESDGLMEALDNKPMAARGSIDSRLHDNLLYGDHANFFNDQSTDGGRLRSLSRLQQVENRPLSSLRREGAAMSRERAESDMGRYTSNFGKFDDNKDFADQNAVDRLRRGLRSPLGFNEIPASSNISQGRSQSPHPMVGARNSSPVPAIASTSPAPGQHHQGMSNGVAPIHPSYTSVQPQSVSDSRSRAVVGTNKGDWICLACGNTNYSWRHVCNMRKCRAPKPGHLAVEPTPPGSWACMSCGNLNYAERMVCNMRKCRAPRPLTQAMLSGVSNVHSSPTNMNPVNGYGQINGYSAVSHPQLMQMSNINYQTSANMYNLSMNGVQRQMSHPQQHVQIPLHYGMNLNGDSVSPKLQYLHTVSSQSLQSDKNGYHGTSPVPYNLAEEFHNGLNLNSGKTSNTEDSTAGS